MDDSSRFGATLNPRLAIVSVLSPSLTLKLLYAAHIWSQPRTNGCGGHEHECIAIAQSGPQARESQFAGTHCDAEYWDQGLITASGFFNRLDNVIQDTAWTKQYVYVQFPDGRYQQRKVLQSFNAGTGVSTAARLS